MKFLLAVLVFSGCGLSTLAGKYSGIVTSTVKCQGVTKAEFTNVFPSAWTIEEKDNQLLAFTGGKCSPVGLSPVVDNEYRLSVKTCLAMTPVGSAFFSGDGLLVDSTGQLIYSTFKWLPNGCTSTERAVLVRQK